MGGQNKLLADLNGRPVLAHVLAAIASSDVAHAVVVTGHDAWQVMDVIQEFDVSHIHNSEFSCGMAASIRTGIGAMRDDIEGALICLGDMPAVSSEALNLMISAFNAGAEDTICVPVFEARRGQPVLFARRYFSQLAGLTGDHGARGVLAANADAVRLVDMPDNGVLLDADTAEKLAGLRDFLS